MPNPAPLRLSVVYDNKAYDEKLKADWGFSCFVEGLPKSILFDTGADGRILLSNMEKLGIPPARVDVVVLSHAHRDHTGGLKDLLRQNPEIEVWQPHFLASIQALPARLKGARFVTVKGAENICAGAFSTGVLGGRIKEQSLVLGTEQGLVLMTGCAHPGIAAIVARTRALFKKDLFLVLGGFHLAGLGKKELAEITRKFRDSGIKKVGPAHCSGDKARTLFQEEYQDDFIKVGVGKKIEI